MKSIIFKYKIDQYKRTTINIDNLATEFKILKLGPQESHGIFVWIQLIYPEETLSLKPDHKITIIPVMTGEETDYNENYINTIQTWDNLIVHYFWETE